VATTATVNVLRQMNRKAGEPLNNMRRKNKSVGFIYLFIPQHVPLQ